MTTQITEMMSEIGHHAKTAAAKLSHASAKAKETAL